MGVVDPFNSKEKKSEFTKDMQEKTAFDKIANREKKDQETLASK